MSELAPVAPRERVVTLDVLRGFALFGVLIGNMYFLFTLREWNESPDTTTLDTIAKWFVMIVVASKAQTMLTFLFGFGFAAQLLRAQRRDEPVMGVYLRRIAVLFVVGVLHVALLWWGDVTWTYAVAAFGLLAFMRASNRTRIIAAIVLTFVPLFVAMIPVVRKASLELLVEPQNLRGYAQSFVAAAQGTVYTDVMWNHIRMALVWETFIYTWYFLWLVGRFLIGYVAGNQGWFDRDGADHLPLFRKLLWFGIVAGGAGTALMVVSLLGVMSDYEISLPGRMAITAIDQLGLFGMVALYVSIIVFLMQRATWRRLLSIIAPVGRMPLTTYVMQSPICTFLFYGWGLGWGTPTSAVTLAIAFAVFAAQVAFAHVWLRYFRFGPLEWVWRSLVYLRRQPMRNRAMVAAQPTKDCR